MKIALVSDAWAPQVNGVVRTLATTVDRLRRRGYDIETITPDAFRTIPCPSYPEIRLALGCGREVARRLNGLDADAVHIATEGPLGWAARRWCLAENRPFTTSFHTRFPDYVALRTGLPPKLFWPIVRHFHVPAAQIMVSTGTLAAELAANGLPHSHLWSRGVDLSLFTGRVARLPDLVGLPRPIQLYVGRVAVEKNIAAFLDCPTPGTKVIVGDGPARAQLEQVYQSARFLGALHGPALAQAYAAADLFVFPSKTDTFGMVMIEALASGVPVAAYPVPGPLDVIGRDGCGQGSAPIGALDQDLGVAIDRALAAQRRDCIAEGRRYSWDASTDQFLAGLERRPALTRLAA
ncbi:glycosyltransferase involved in cell wall biosynthesis [Sphingomonas vulcanisoli]|uniref:Glycosyltransferase involved in cell wall biosynthesis n=1 Tax=Sphingomonas vulcanisoli TaxID=1658060 RepID=A0ABX0TWB2_9SPHN|nr:glycosyltransferase family 1 protein [Sphingomonas vulcanisoli]NIJ08682.1 glycosyltransferase involved in cell wall biosynthesis [Sphingomonas vulcanisoli]